MMYLNGFVFANRNFNQHYKNVDGTYKMGKKYCDFNAIRINNYVIPRATLHYNYKLIWSYELSDLFYLTPSDNEYNTECSNCEYSEMCNGQLCMFAMM